jgi:hypothetical protein
MVSSHSSEQKKFLMSSWPYFPAVVIYADLWIILRLLLKIPPEVCRIAIA